MSSLQHLKREVFYLLPERLHEVCLSFLLIKMHTVYVTQVGRCAYMG